MKLWYHAGYTPMNQLLDVARILDEVGFEGIGLSHHLVTPEKVDGTYPYAEDGEKWWGEADPHPDPWVTAVAIGNVTERILIGPSVSILPLQDPFTVAKAASTAAWFVPGRIVLGIGVGWMSDEFDLVHADFHTRGRRTDDMLAVINKLFNGGMVEHTGTDYQFGRLRMDPLPAERVPIYVGGESPAALRRAARADGWFAAGPHEPKEVVRRAQLMQAARREAGRAELPFECIAPVWDIPSRSEWDAMAEAGVTATMYVPSRDTDIKTLEDRRAYIERVVDLTQGYA